MNTDHTTEELAHRTSDGLDVSLVWDRVSGTLRIVVVDSRSGVSFELPAREAGRRSSASTTPSRTQQRPSPDRSGRELTAGSRGRAMSA